MTPPGLLGLWAFWGFGSFGSWELGVDWKLRSCGVGIDPALLHSYPIDAQGKVALIAAPAGAAGDEELRAFENDDAVGAIEERGGKREGPFEVGIRIEISDLLIRGQDSHVRRRVIVAQRGFSLEAQSDVTADRAYPQGS